MRLTKIKIALIIIIALLSVAVFYVIKNKTPFEKLNPAVGGTAPEISLADMSGKMMRLSDFQGKVVLVNFWASWCPPCKEEMKWFQKIYIDYEDKGFTVIGIAINEISPSLIRDMGILFPILIANERVLKDYGGISDAPVSFLIGRDGTIIKKVKKVYPEDALKKDVEAALKMR